MVEEKADARAREGKREVAERRVSHAKHASVQTRRVGLWSVADHERRQKSWMQR